MFEVDDTVFTKNIAYDYTSIESIPAIEASDLSYSSFFNDFMLLNLPCIIKGITKNWQCLKCWITENNGLNFEYLEEHYGMDMVQVYNCKERFYNTQKSYSCCFSDYINNIKDKPNVLINTSYEYVKNWHLQLNHPEERFYEVPIYFASDWLNEYYVNCMDDDYRFVYMGSNGTWTPFHADVFSSYSWSANVFGKKRWLIFPPGNEEILRNSLGDLPYDVEGKESISIARDCMSIRTESISIAKESISTAKESISSRKESMLIRSGHSSDTDKQCIEVVQNPGEAIFIPSGWYHQVQNISYAISVNHNWVNGCNINMMYESLLRALNDVKEEIKDYSEMDDFEQHCQLMLNAHFGMNFEQFYKFLLYIASKRMEMLQELCPKTLFHGQEIGTNHILFDLQSLKTVLEKFITLDEIKVLDFFSTVSPRPHDLFDEVSLILEIHSIFTNLGSK
ncbi:2-oxoglutarate and iron-dependent oxygenase JMJD4 [Diabrotica virgifera virgifera]|uniref:Jumonji domain-containing protein 4 n=1 Tax=Diabrotica virgifera virgifera TaxID=50390 RepID=A0A6P7F3R7_DIAVI|nr:2-oxoglutarate and iron-dependent oxygenase JMJD4 [Diabrotica virgifera virgifera]